MEPSRSGENTDNPFHKNAERDVAPSDHMRCATIIVSSYVGVLPSPMQSITAFRTAGGSIATC